MKKITNIFCVGKTAFLRFLTSHQWLFAVFPSRVFVSVRRQLPEFDYASFINEVGDQCFLRHSDAIDYISRK